MKIERLKPENVSVLNQFVIVLSDEMGIRFNKDFSTDFERLEMIGKKIKKESFESPYLISLSIGYKIIFIPFSDDTVELWKIEVTKRGNGFGSELLSKILDVSDRTGIKIKLVPIGFDKDENTPKNYTNRLKCWYNEMGFERPKFPTIDPYYTYNPSVEKYKMVA
jgi:hypothetical protein